MDEILLKKHTKQIMKYGINKELAKEIVLISIEAGKGKDIEMYINYAIDLNYGIGLSSKIQQIN